jgi:hypothetical protein
MTMAMKNFSLSQLVYVHTAPHTPKYTHFYSIKTKMADNSEYFKKQTKFMRRFSNETN